MKINAIEDEKEKTHQSQKIINDSIITANEISESGEPFEAGEFLISIAEMLEGLTSYHSVKLYKLTIKYWNNEVSSFKMQGKLHEVAEIFLRIADLYEKKLDEPKSYKKNILGSIDYLKRESKLLLEFNENRKLAQNYENIAGLYLKVVNYKNAIKYYLNVIEIAKGYHYFDLLSYSYQQISDCYQQLDEIEKSNSIIYDGIEFFSTLFQSFEAKNENLAISQIAKVLKSLHHLVDDEEQFIIYSKKEAGAYINLAERLKKHEENYYKIARYYRGAALCYKEINNNLIESASCFVLAGNYSEGIEEFNEAAINFFNAAVIFKELNNLEMTYKHYVKAGDNYWKLKNVNDSTESYLNAYDIAVEGGLEYNKFGIFNQIVRGLNIIAKEGLKNKQFYTAATLIMESIKFYQQLDTAKEFLVNEMLKNVYRYYYKAANLKNIGSSHIVQSYIMAAISSILNGNTNKALKILSEIDMKGYTIKKYKELVEIIIEWVSDGREVEFENFPYDIQRIITGSEEIGYLLRFFKGYRMYY
jgi:tetratricopeptide (TPR) repeat protein